MLKRKSETHPTGACDCRAPARLICQRISAGNRSPMQASAPLALVTPSHPAEQPRRSDAAELPPVVQKTGMKKARRFVGPALHCNYLTPFPRTQYAEPCITTQYGMKKSADIYQTFLYKPNCHFFPLRMERLFLVSKRPAHRATLYVEGIGGCATNKQKCKCRTFALLATLIHRFMF